MRNQTLSFNKFYSPKSALIFFRSSDKAATDRGYVEHYDIDSFGRLRNPHPLSELEARKLSKVMDVEAEQKSAFLKPTGLMPSNVLTLDPCPHDGFVMWYTKSGVRDLYFVDGLTIPNGKAHVPALVWKASRSSLRVFALTSDKKPKANSKLYNAPFFNLDSAGRVCMGSVNVAISTSASLQQFMAAWESYFFNSYFSHLMGNHNPVEGNLIQLWQAIIGTDHLFPSDLLKLSQHSVNSLINSKW